MLAVWILPLLTVGTSAIVCTPNICDGVRCADILFCMEQDNMYVKENGGFCGCCHACITLLDEGDDCPVALMGIPAMSECKKGTYCNEHTHRCEAIRKKRATGPCAEKREELNQILENSEHSIDGLTLPTCDEDGTYAPKQCVEAVCFCVDRKGNHLRRYRSHISNSQGMSCKCAREEDDSKHQVGKHLYCSSNGNYQGLQCLGSKCFCVDETEGTPIGEAVNRWEADQLNC